jgi:hypothetical protein
LLPLAPQSLLFLDRVSNDSLLNFALGNQAHLPNKLGKCIFKRPLGHKYSSFGLRYLQFIFKFLPFSSIFLPLDEKSLTQSINFVIMHYVEREMQ